MPSSEKPKPKPKPILLRGSLPVGWSTVGRARAVLYVATSGSTTTAANDDDELGD